MSETHTGQFPAEKLFLEPGDHQYDKGHRFAVHTLHGHNHYFHTEHRCDEFIHLHGFDIIGHDEMMSIRTQRGIRVIYRNGKSIPATEPEYLRFFGVELPDDPDDSEFGS